MFLHGFYFILMATVVTCMNLGKVMDRHKRVIGGEVYTKGDYPSHVSLWYMGSDNTFNMANLGGHHTCGGVLVAPSWVLTSAYCFDDMYYYGARNTSLWKVYLGMHGQRDAENEAQYREIDEIHISPEYDDYSLVGDIALLKLVTPATLNDQVDVMAINEDPHCPGVGQDVDIIGWGQNQMEHYGPSTNYPHKITVQTDSLKYCQNQYFAPDIFNYTQGVIIDERNLCAGIPEGGKDGCFGDSGSPLLATCGQREVVVGLISWGWGCAEPGFPSVNTRVSAFSLWIRNTMNTPRLTCC